MGARGIYHAQETHFVNILPPINASGGKTTAVLNTKNYQHVSIFLNFGVQSAALKTVQLQSSDNGSPVATTAIPFDLYKCETGYQSANGDVLGAKVAVTAAGFSPSGTGNIMYVIELDTATLPAGQDYVQLVLTDNSPAASSVLSQAVAILSAGRHTHDQSETVLT